MTKKARYVRLEACGYLIRLFLLDITMSTMKFAEAKVLPYSSLANTKHHKTRKN